MAQSNYSTHEVTNQSPPFRGINLFLSDAALQKAVAGAGVAAADEELAAFGGVTGSAEAFEMGRLANENPPKLLRFDEKGFPLDRVDFHPAYHEAMAISFSAGLHSSPWEHLAAPPGAAPRAAAHTARAARLYMMTQTEPGHICPVTMTNAAVPALLMESELAGRLLPKILSRSYDNSFKPWMDKESISLGMGLTEKQGGTDVRANATMAQPVGGARGPGQEYVLTGHKWFLSAPMSDAFLMLAQAPAGLSCFFVPRFLPDGTINALRLQRLKNKLGNRSNASSEVELKGAHGWLIGEEGRGIANIIEMVTMTRLDCAIASAGQMRLALATAIHHCRYRAVFQKRLIDQPLMAAVLADMAIDVEAATALAFRLARAFDGAAVDTAQAAWRRVMTPVTKYWVCKMAPALGYEAMECLGGNGYVEDGLAARLYRELPLNAIWEGSGNVMCLDVLRVLNREPDAVSAVIAELKCGSHGDAALSAAVSRIAERISRGAIPEAEARGFIEDMARTAAGALLRKDAPPFVSDAFIGSRLHGGFRHTYGAGAVSADSRAIIERALPAS